MITAYILKNYKRGDGTFPIYFRIYLDRQKVLIPAGVNLPEGSWDSVNQRAKGNSSRDTNLILNRVRSRINDVFVKYRLNNRRLTKEVFLRDSVNRT